jgi:hypothetical protein
LDVERERDTTVRMKKKSKAAKDRAPAAQIAKLAGISTSRVYRLRAEGRPDSLIISMSQQRREQQMLLRNLPVTPIDAGSNGHAAHTVLTLSAAQTEKERWAGALRRLEYQERSGELIRVADVRLFCARLLTEAKDILLTGPSELADSLAAETDPQRVEEILRRWLERSLDLIVRLKLWSERPEAPEAA